VDGGYLKEEIVVSRSKGALPKDLSVSGQGEKNAGVCGRAKTKTLRGTWWRFLNKKKTWQPASPIEKSWGTATLKPKNKQKETRPRKRGGRRISPTKPT